RTAPASGAGSRVAWRPSRPGRRRRPRRSPRADAADRRRERRGGDRSNRAAMTHMRGAVRLEIVPGATHLFEERGALDAVANLARRWFTDYLAPPIPSPRG